MSALIYDVFSSQDVIMEPLQNGCRNKNVTGHKAPTQRSGGGVQTLTMLMNAPCSLIMSRAERSFLLAIFLMKYRWKWALVRWCLFRGQQNRGGGKK